MKQTLVKITDDHYVVVDDSEIKEDCYALHEGPLGEREIVTANGQCKLDKKIISSTQPIETFNWMGNSEKGYDTIKPLSLQEIKELIGEVDVVELSKKTTKHQKFANGLHEEVVAQMFYRKGYNQALEDNKEKKYTEEDLRKAIEFGRGQILDNISIGIIHEQTDNFIQSLQPKTEWEVTFDEQGKLRLV